MSSPHVLNIGKQFSRFPAGRYAKDGPASGEEFRERVLLPLLNQSVPICIELDDAIGFGSSFLEEAFGGLVRRGWKPDDLLGILTFISEDLSLVDEIRDYIKEAGEHAGR